jgi:hypothetical protein
MKIIRALRLLQLALILGCILSIVLLLNITAPNPTGRRYSSEGPAMDGARQIIGSEGERILANDLGLPNNNQPDQRQCLCQTAALKPGECNVCLPVQSLGSTYRVPDFIGPNFIAESKNRENLLYQGREVDQIADYVVAAQELGRPLWLYVRVDTMVAPDFEQMVNSTGGGVVYYFKVDGYVDGVDAAAQTGLLASAGLLTGFTLTEALFRRAKGRWTARRLPASTDRRAADKMRTAETFLDRARGKALSRIDEEDSRIDP